MTLTTNEVAALAAIYADVGDDLVSFAYSAKVNPFANKRTLAGVYASLQRKGLIECGCLEDERGRNQVDTVQLTEAGIAAAKEAS